MKISEFQKQQRKWVQTNFNFKKTWRSALEPLAGIVEEYGEYLSSVTKEEHIDALADMGIFLTDVANRIGYNLVEPDLSHPKFQFTYFNETLGELSHCILKMAQGIRQDEPHEITAHKKIEELFRILVSWSYTKYGLSYYSEILFPTWEEIVSKRNWNKERESNA
tara:strand:+ start:11660 stop:12154 length:495 start_codon:yes stop_codon:yes gene_type:complete